MVECNLAKVKVAGSNPVSRSNHLNNRAALAALFPGSYDSAEKTQSATHDKF